MVEQEDTRLQQDLTDSERLTRYMPVLAVVTREVNVRDLLLQTEADGSVDIKLLTPEETLLGGKEVFADAYAVDFSVGPAMALKVQRRLREDPQTAASPIYAIGSGDHAIDEATVCAYGAAGSVTKPFSAVEVWS